MELKKKEDEELKKILEDICESMHENFEKNLLEFFKREYEVYRYWNQPGMGYLDWK